MKRVFIAALLLVLVLFTTAMTGAPKASAHVAAPMTGICGTGCEGYVDWNGGTNYGMKATFYLPNFTGSSTYDLERYISEYRSDCTWGTSTLPCWINVGYCFGTNTAHNRSECINNNGEWFFTECDIISGTTECFPTTLGAINNADKGFTVDMGMTNESTTSDGDFNVNITSYYVGIYIENLHSSPDVCTDWEANSNSGDNNSWPCYADGSGRGIDYIKGWTDAYLKNYTIGSFTGTRQGIADITRNIWLDVSEVAHWQTSNPSGSSVQGAQLYPHVLPSMSTTGGDFYMCNEDNGLTTCS